MMTKLDNRAGRARPSACSRPNQGVVGRLLDVGEVAGEPVRREHGPIPGIPVAGEPDLRYERR